MTYLGIRTDSPVAELYLYQDETMAAEMSWRADRKLAHDLLGKLEAFLKESGLVFSDLDGLFVFKGPGSFTGLRIGITVMNTVAYAERVAIVGSEGDDWRNLAVRRLRSGEDDRIVLPLYGAEARITKPKK